MKLSFRLQLVRDQIVNLVQIPARTLPEPHCRLRHVRRLW